jgi:membrane-bound lytic murein transglycosylase A
MLLGGCGLALLAGCAPKPGLYVLSSRQVRTRTFADELNFRGLPEAVRQSMRYYRGLPDGVVFNYGEHTYTAREMEASMTLFLDLVASLEGEARLEAIREKFLFFESRNEKGGGFFTGYYEPVLPGSLEPSKQYQAPIYAVPGDLITVDLEPYAALGLLPGDLENKTLRGKLEGRKVVPYDSRDRIYYESSLEDRAEVLAYVPNHIELSFLQIQGSGLLRLEDGTLLRLNYTGQNGHPYRPLGRILLDRIPRGRMSLQALKEYLYAHPEEARDILNYNPSYTFFRLVEEGPLGMLEVPLTPGRSVALDYRILPRGGVVYFETTLPARSVEGAAEPLPFGRFGVMQDTGGAIRGHGRADIFWGQGEKAEKIAGPMRQKGRLFLLVARKEFLD